MVDEQFGLRVTKITDGESIGEEQADGDELTGVSE